MKFCLEQIEWKNNLWTRYAAFWLVRAWEDISFARSKTSGVERYFYARPLNWFHLLQANWVEVQRLHCKATCQLPLVLLLANVVKFRGRYNLWTSTQFARSKWNQLRGIGYNLWISTQFAWSKWNQLRSIVYVQPLNIHSICLEQMETFQRSWMKIPLNSTRFAPSKWNILSSSDQSGGSFFHWIPIIC